MINPAFVRYPEEAKLLGEMVLGYGELDITFCMMCGKAIHQQFELLHAVNQVRSETARLDIANAMAGKGFSTLGLEAEYARLLRCMRVCLRIRNQWAHSQWGDMDPHGLAFTRTDGDVFAAPVKPTVWLSIKVDLLRKQEAYFEHTRLRLLVLLSNLTPILVGKKGLLRPPPEMPEPNMHNQWSKSARDHIDSLPTLRP